MRQPIDPAHEEQVSYGRPTKAVPFRWPPSRWRNARLRQFFSMSILVFGIGAAASPASGQSPGTFTFDSGSCREDTEETIYITLLGTVFRLPMERLHGVDALRSEYELLVPPPVNAGEPLGCPANPLPADSITISVPRPDDLMLPPTGVSNIWVSDTIIPVFRLRMRAAPRDFYGLQSANIREAQEDCSGGEVRQVTPHLQECTVIPIGPDWLPREAWAASYLADPTHHSILFQEHPRPHALPFAVTCTPSIRIRDCNASYKLLPNVNITYDVDISVTSPEHLIPIDRAIRQPLLSWWVWTSPPILP